MTVARRAATITVLLAAGLAGCQSADTKKAADSNSILAVFSPPTPAQAARWAVDPYDADNRCRGLLLLANAPWGGASVYVELYRRALADGDSGVRAVAVRALALHGTPEDVPLIVKQFNDPDRALRWECARALQRLHNDDAIVPLRDHLDPKKEVEPEIRGSSANALAQYPDRRVFEALIAGLDDRDLNVADQCQQALEILTGQKLGDDPRPWVAWAKGRTDLFADRKVYLYPIFWREPDWLESIIPFLRPPNEIAAAPVGAIPPPEDAAAAAAAAKTTTK